MDRLEIYPSEGRLSLGLATGVLIALAGFILMAYLSQVNAAWTAWFVVALGAGFLIDAVVRLYRPRPVFAADHEGFSVKGGRTRPWQDFRGVVLHEATNKGTVTHRLVRVKYAGPFWNRGRSINYFHQSGEAWVMAQRIDAYADKIREARAEMGKTFGAGPSPVVAARLGKVPHTDPVDVEYNWFTQPWFKTDRWF